MQDSHYKTGSAKAGLSPASRRGFFLGTAGVGAAAATVALLPKVEAPVASTPTPVKNAPEKGGGYTLSEHIQRYYRSTSA